MVPGEKLGEPATGVYQTTISIQSLDSKQPGSSRNLQIVNMPGKQGKHEPYYQSKYYQAMTGSIDAKF